MSSFGVKLELPVIRFDQKQFTIALRADLQTQLRQAARAFLRAVIKRVPVDTGEARGTLLPLGRFLNISVPIPNAKPIPNKDAGTGEMENPLIFEFESTEEGEFFKAQLQLFHYWWNDFFSQHYTNAQIDPPWHSIDDGVDAFMAYIKTEGVRKLPRIKNFCFRAYVKVDGGNIFRLPERPI